MVKGEGGRVRIVILTKTKIGVKTMTLSCQSILLC